MRHRPRLSAAILLFVATVALAIEPAPEKPTDVGAKTAIEVRLVTIDALVLDRAERTVSDLVRDDFTLTVDGQPAEIETFDVDCAIGDSRGTRS